MITEEVSLEKIVDSVPGFVFQFEMCRSGITRFPFVSKGFDNIFEVAADQFKEDASLTLSRIHTEDYQSLMYNMFNCYENGTTFSQTFRIVSSVTNKTIWLKVSAIPELHDPKYAVWNGYMSDITLEIEVQTFN